MAKLKIFWVFGFSFFVFLPTAYSYNLKPYKQSNGALTYKIDAASFSTLNGRSLNQSQAKYWVQTAMSKWVTKSGLDLAPDYTGTTSSSCANENDGINTIGVRPEIDYDKPELLAHASIHFDPITNLIASWDICLYADAAIWETIASNMSTGEIDLVGVLVHEIGHVWGLDHTPETAMNFANLTGNNGRHLFADDIKGVRAIYPELTPMTLKAYWRKANASSWGPRSGLPYSVHFRPVRGAIGKDLSKTVKDRVIVGSLPEVAAPFSPTQIRFYRAAYPLTSSTGWSLKSYNLGTWDSPAIASNHSGGEFLAAVPMRMELDNSCLGMYFYHTDDSFDSVTTYSYDNMCSTDSPAIAWNASLDKWILVWVEHSRSNPVNTNRLMYSVSEDGLYWYLPKPMGIYSLETPGLACSPYWPGECLLTYTRGSSLTPTVVSRKITFNNPTGVVSLGTWNQHQSYVQREVSAARTGGAWRTAWSYSSSGDWRSKGWGGLYTKNSTSNPPVGSAVFSGEYAEHPGSLVGSGYYSSSYLFYVD